MSVRRSVAAALTCAALVVTGLAVPGPATASGHVSPLRLHAPGSETVYSYKGKTFIQDGVELIAVGQSFEIWSHRANYRSPITSEWHEGSTVTPLPDGLTDDFSGLSRFLDVRIVDDRGRTVVHRQPSVCLDGYQTYRVVPSGAAHSTYPYDCPRNGFARGSVQGIAAGWATETQLFGYRMLRLVPGHYRMTISITPLYRRLFGITVADARRAVRLTVRKVPRHGGGGGGGGGGAGGGGVPIPVSSHPGAAPATVPATVPAPLHRAGAPLADPPANSPEPDLAALPAWGIQLSRGGRYLNFAATVWNAGDSPLVVDGFREKNKPVMDAYQYFYDAAGNEIGYVPAGHMDWDARPTHRHWHFENFARYQLLDASRTKVQRSHKEAFCLADTDAIDLTVPGAQWQPTNTDLGTACGGFSALAVSEYLSSGNGDTYEQFRAGQSFDLKHVPNGTYYIAVQANPAHVLTEQTTANDEALRKLRLGGTPEHRTLYVYPVGDVDN